MANPKDSKTVQSRRPIGWTPMGFIAAYLAILVLLLLQLYVLWPGGTWILSWYSRTTEAEAALAVSAIHAKSLSEARELLAREKESKASQSVWTTDETNRLNKTMGLSRELLLAFSSRSSHTEINIPSFGGKARPLAQTINDANDALTEASAALKIRVQALQTPPKSPTICKALRMKLPEGDEIQSAAKPLPSEVEEYNAALKLARKDHPVALFDQVEIHYLILILLFGTMGSTLRGVASLVRYIGNEELDHRWLPYYATLPFVGGGLAVAFYAVLRGGFMSVSSPVSEVTNLYSCIGFAVLVGLASREAQRQIQLIAGTLFSKDEGDKGKMGEPRIRDLVLDEANKILRILGDRLSGDTVVLLNDKAAKPSKISATTIEVPLENFSPASIIKAEVQTSHGTTTFEKDFGATQ